MDETVPKPMTFIRRLSSLLLLILAGVCLAPAQTASGSLSGSILDANGALVPGANVVATHVPTNRQYPTVSTEAGLYVYPSLPPGPYSVTVEKAGFKKLVRTGIEVRTGSRAELPLKLEVGEVQQSIEVSAQAQVLETTVPERGQNLSPQVLSSLPIYNGGLRSAENFINYMPGVNVNGETSINGSNGRAKEVEIDGASMTSPESGGLAMQFPGFEAFQEMKLVTSSFNAEFGRLGGGLEMFTTKSGTNMIHGAVFLNMKRDIFDAASWASNATKGRTPGYRAKERYNEEGFAVGGPAYIPKIYDGRNRTFFYLTYTKDVRPAQTTTYSGETVATSLMKQGIFSEAGVATIYDPATTTLVDGVNTRTPFAGNVIPKVRWSAISTKILPYIPDPTGSGINGNYTLLGTSTQDDKILTIKADHSITQSNRVSFFLTHRTQLASNVQYLPGPLSNGLDQYQRPDDYRVNHDLVISPTVLLHSSFGLSRTQQAWNNPLQYGYASKWGFPLSGDSDATPRVNFATDSFTAWGMNQGKVNNGGQWNTTYHLAQSLSWVRGTHEFKFGWDLRRMKTRSEDLYGTNGYYTFSSAQTALNPSSISKTGNSFASFLLGTPYEASSTATPVTKLQARYGYHAGFFQDNWRITPNFTLSYGVRYEIPIGWHDVDGNYSSLNTAKPNAGAGGLPGALIFAGYGAGRENKKRLYNTDFSSVGPRVGFAYRAGAKTSIRGGFGIYYQALGNGGCGCQDGFSGSFAQSSDGFNPAFYWDQGGVQPPAGFKPPPRLDPSFDNFGTTVYRMSDSYGKAPRIYNWSLTIQREVKNFVIEAAYVGNRGHGLNSTVYLNQLPVSNLSLGSLLGKNINSPEVKAAGYSEPFTGFAQGWKAGATLAQALRPFPQFSNVVDVNAGVGKTWYDSMQTKVERKFGNFQLMASYVWSKSLASMTYRQIFSQGSQVQTGNAYDLSDSKSLSYFDIPHFVNILTSYNLPFGKGKRLFTNAGRALDLVVSGWTISGAQQYRSGGLIQVTTSGNPNDKGVIFAPVTKGKVVPGATIRTGISSRDLDPNDPTKRWFNTGSKAPFVNADAYALGNSSNYYDDFRNPWVRTENVSIQKDFNIWETVKLQYRADALNIFNRTAFGGVNGTLGYVKADGTYSNPNFGRATGAQVAARVISMGLRVEF
jgi:hypothetical protein